MNEMYHSFTIGFNWWFVVGPVMALIMALIGSLKYYLDGIKIKRAPKGFDKWLKIAAAGFDVILHVMIFEESLIGMLQWLINHTDGDPIWSVIVAPIIMLFTFILAYCAFYTCGKLGEWAKHGYVIDKRKERIEEQNIQIKKKLREMQIITLAKPKVEKVEAEVVDEGWRPGRDYFKDYTFYQGFGRQATY